MSERLTGLNRLAALLALACCESATDGEALAAARAAGRLLRAQSWSLEALLGRAGAKRPPRPFTRGRTSPPAGADGGRGEVRHPMTRGRR